MDNTIMTVDNYNFICDNDNTLSPKSETENVLFIDESIDHSIINQTDLNNDLIEDEIKVIKKNKKNSKQNGKETRKQQCFTCGKVMSSRQVYTKKKSM